MIQMAFQQRMAVAIFRVRDGFKPETRCQCYKTFFGPEFTDFWTKLEPVLFVPGKLFQSSQTLKSVCETRLEKLARHKKFSLLGEFLNYGQKSFITLGQGVNVIKLFLAGIY